MRIVVLDIQHAGQPSRPNDRGARADLDESGAVDFDEHEALLTPLYAKAAAAWLAARGVTVLQETYGEYRDRQARTVTLALSNPQAQVAYVACHLNAGKGDYGLVVHDHRSWRGRSLAYAMKRQLAELAELTRTVAGTDAPDQFPRATRCIDGIYAGPANVCGVVFEPCFMDTPAHRPLLTDEGLARIGQAIGKGLLDWFEGRV